MSDAVESVMTLIAQNRAWAGPLVGLLAFGESLAIVGLLIPGTALMVGIGGLVGTGALDPWTICLWAVLGAVGGDWLSFLIGRKLGPPIYRRWPLNRHREAVARARLFFRRFGVWAVFLGRFLGPVRAVVPLVAGVMRMERRPFQIANGLSALIWVPVVLAPGYLAARRAGPPSEIGATELLAFGGLMLLVTLAAGVVSARMLGGKRARRAPSTRT